MNDDLIKLNCFIFLNFKGVTAGVVVAQVFTLHQLLGTEELWHYALSFYIVLVIICFIPYAWYPESPKYLYIVAGKRDQARNGMQQLVIFILKKDLSIFLSFRIASITSR